MSSSKEKPILLVEDNPDDVELTLRSFQKNRICNPVIVAKDGVEALDYLLGKGSYAERDTTQMPQVILLDLKLPKLNGLEVLKEIRSNPLTQRVPVVILTSSREEQDLLQGYDLGANSYIVKPVDLDQFMEAAKTLGLYWLVLNQTAD